MKNTFIRVLALLILAIILVTSVSCGETENPNDTTPAVAETTVDNQTVPEETTVSYDPKLEAKDWGGNEFYILYNGNDLEPNLDFVAEDVTGATLNDAVYKRNVAIQEKYKLKISSKYSGDSTTMGSAQAANASGDCSIHLCEVNQNYSMSMAINGFIHCIDELTNINTDKPYWIQSQLAGSSIKGKNYFAYSDANVHAVGATPVTIFNKKVREQFGLDDIYQLVYDGKWTYAKMSELVKVVTGDLDGDQQITKDDRLGLIANTFSIDCFISGSGYQMLTKDDEDLPAISINTEKFISIIEGIQSLCSVENGMFLVDRTSTATEAREYWTEWAITADRALFWIGNFKCVERLRASDTDFGVVPIPKATEDQQNYAVHMQANIGAAMSVPNCVTDVEGVSAVLEDIAYQSYLTVMPAYIEVLIQGQSIRDAESLKCISIIRSSYYCDMGFMLSNFGVALLGTFRSCVMNNTGVASVVTGLEKNFPNQLKKIKKALG